MPVADRYPPALRYSGITFILSHPGRFDLKKLCDGYASKEIESALAPISRYACEFRLGSCVAPLLPDTRVVLLCGALLLPKFLGKLSGQIDQLRGSPYERNGIYYIPTYHTQDAYDRQEYESRLNENFKAQITTENPYESEDAEESEETTKSKGKTSRANYGFWLRQDIKKACRLSKGASVQDSSINYTLRPPLQVVLDTLNSFHGKSIYFDIETFPDTCQMSCFAVGVLGESILSVSLISFKGTLTYTPSATASILRELAGLLDKCASIIIHNAQFDLAILAWKYKICPPAWNKIEDTMLMHAKNYIGVEKSLGHCISLYTDLPYHKDEGVFNPHTYEDETKLLLYNAKDVETLMLVHTGILEHARILGTLSSMGTANHCLRAYLGCTLRGILLNDDALCAHIDALHTRTEWFEDKVLAKLVGYPLNPRSPKQVGEYLYTNLGLPKPKGDISPTGKGTLYKIQQKHDLPSLGIILYIRRMSKDAGTLAFTRWKENRATCTYHIAGTKSGRLASKAFLGRWGTNLQNLNKERCRRFFIPDPGMEFVQVDQAGAEALVVTSMTKPGSNLRKLSQAGVKTHTYFCMHVFADVWQERLFKNTDCHIKAFLECPIDKLTSLERWPLLSKAIAASDSDIPSRRYYHHAKMAVHGGNYGIAGEKFCNQVLDKSDGEIVLSLAEGTRLIEKLHEVFPEIRQDFQAYVRQEISNKNILSNLFGHPREFYHYGRAVDEVLIREAFSFIPQSTVGLITSMCITELQAALDEGTYTGFEILANTHDSVLVQCPIGDGTRVAGLIKPHMNRKLTSIYGEEFNMKSDFTIGSNWEMKH